MPVTLNYTEEATGVNHPECHVIIRDATQHYFLGKVPRLSLVCSFYHTAATAAAGKLPFHEEEFNLSDFEKVITLSASPRTVYWSWLIANEPTFKDAKEA